MRRRQRLRSSRARQKKNIKGEKKNRNTQTHIEKSKGRTVMCCCYSMKIFVAFALVSCRSHSHTQTHTHTHAGQDEENRNLRAALSEKISCLHTLTQAHTRKFSCWILLIFPFQLPLAAFYRYDFFSLFLLLVFAHEKNCFWGCTYTASAEISSLFTAHTHSKDD